MTERQPPALPYGTQLIDDDDIEAVVTVLRGRWLTTGPAVAAFETELARIGHARFAVAVASGTAALHTAYAAAGLDATGEIVTSPLTFVATASAALMLGARVRFADVDAATGLIDPEHAADALTPATRVVVAVDYAGHPADYDALAALCAERGLLLAADASHSLGATLGGRAVGSLADVTTLSFHPVKAITTGEGGAVLTSNAAIELAARRFRNHGIVRDDARTDPAWHYDVRSLGMNYRLPDVLCALGLSQLGKLHCFIARRRALAARYTAAFADVPGLMLPVERPGAVSSWHLYVLRVQDASRRDALFDALRADGIGVQVHYIPAHRHTLLAELGYREGQFPAAEAFAARALSIPLYPHMSDTDAERVIESVRRAARTHL